MSPIDRFDPADVAFVADPYPTLNEIRESSPIWWSDRFDAWMVTRFDDVATSLRDRRMGRAYTHRFTHEEFGQPEPDPRWSSFHEHDRWSLLSIEPPDHTRLRRLVQRVFTPRAISSLRERVVTFSADLLDDCSQIAASGDGTFDLISDYAQPFSVAVICSMLGVPHEDARRLLDWSHDIVKMYEVAGDDDSKVRADAAAGEYITYTRDLIARKRAVPDDLLLSQLIAVTDDGDTLTDDEIICTAMVLVEAGHEATVNTLGNGFRALMHHRQEWERLTSGDVPADDAVEELLRFDAPLQLFERWVLDDGVEIAGQPIAVGEKIAMLFGSAQRDPRRFADPDRFDIGRGDAAHIGFGGGIHFCIGAPLARMELAVSVEGLVRNFPGLTLAVEPEYHPTFVIRGLQELRLKV